MISPLALAANVAARVQIKDVLLLATSAERALELGSGGLSVRTSNGAETTVEERALTVKCRFRMEANRADSDEVKVSVDALYVIRYELSSAEGLTKEALDRFGEYNGTYNAWPYWREFLNSTIVRMGLPSLVVPVFRLADATQHKAPQGSQTSTPGQ
jgi:hypothetical protein